MDNFDLRKYLKENILLENEENMGIITFKGIPVKLTFRKHSRFALEIQEKFSPKTIRGLQNQLNMLNNFVQIKSYNEIDYMGRILIDGKSLIDKLDLKPSDKPVDRKDKLNLRQISSIISNANLDVPPYYVELGNNQIVVRQPHLTQFNISPSDFKIKNVKLSYDIEDSK